MKEAQKKFREDAILDATHELLIAKGYAAMTLEDVMDAVGIAKATLYLHFKSKEELAASVVLRELEKVASYLSAQDPNLPAGQRVEDFVRWLFAQRFREPGLLMGDFGHHLQPSKNTHPRRMEIEDVLNNAVESLVSEGQREGDLRDDVSTAVLAQTVVGAVRDEGYEIILRQGRMKVDEIASQILRLISTRG